MSHVQISLTAEDFVQRAKQQTGIDHISDPKILIALEHFVQSLNSEAALNQAGAIGAEKRILRVLCNRLRMLRDIDAHPEIHDQEIIGPVFISGLNRTGTTKLQKMLASSGDFFWNRLWQVFSLSLQTGNRDEDPAPRIADAHAFVDWFDQQAPSAKLTHHYETFEPEEEAFIFEHCRFGALMLAFYNVPSFLAWWATQDIKEEYEFLKMSLKYLQWQRYPDQSKPWLLKYPFYLGAEAALKDVFPRAKFIAPHRKLETVIASSASLLKAYRSASSDADYDATFGPTLLASLASGTENIVDLRESDPDFPILDISFHDVVRDGPGIAEKIYQHIDLPLSERARQAMLEWERSNPQHKKGVHAYSLQDFGITEEEIGASCQKYLAHFSDLL